jgi:hypothetical protein
VLGLRQVLARPLWPKEHGAYGQLAFPLITALAVAGVSAGGTLMTTAVLAGFLAHEPAAVVLGLRGPRARRELGSAAVAWLLVLLAGGGMAGVAAVWTLEPVVRWSLAVPAIPAVVLVIAMLRHQEKSWYGEASAAMAFSGAAVPVTMAAGATIETAAAVAIPFALLFVTTTLAVRVVILSVRGGGDPRAAAATRHATVALSAGAAFLLLLASLLEVLPPSLLLVATPGLLTAGTIAMCPPPPSRLRRVGWTLVAVSVVTSVLVLSTA